MIIEKQRLNKYLIKNLIIIERKLLTSIIARDAQIEMS